MKQLVFVQDKEIENELKIETEIIKVINVSSDRLNDEIKRAKNLVIIQGGNEEVNRIAVENRKVDILLSPEKNDKKDFMYARNSGLNQVLCELARKNNVAIGFNFSEVLNSSERSKLIGRMKQNVRICKKYKVKMIFSSFAKNKYELRSEDCLKTFERILNS